MTRFITSLLLIVGFTFTTFNSNATIQNKLNNQTPDIGNTGWEEDSNDIGNTGWEEDSNDIGNTGWEEDSNDIGNTGWEEDSNTQ